ncbi:MAG: DNA-protecting protein DprA [Nitrospirae bacterium]|nr:MAG: DNA-protecting protein DprA [Nitrospirota bacterium]
MADDLRYWIALVLAREVGPLSAGRLLSAFRTPERIFSAPAPELGAVEGMTAAKIKALTGFNDWDGVNREIDNMDRFGIAAITAADEAYPGILRQIPDPPPVLFVKGALTEDDRYSVAIVGSRKMTGYGRTVAGRMSSGLARCGLTIVSGMARGIDTVAHTAALDVKGRTTAVLGCGLDRPYPPENLKLFERIREAGCIVSEFPTGTPPLREHFPRRNRIISGLSLGTVVIEATTDSGSLITANMALDQNREVFAVPGNITSKSSEGTNKLIKKGAKLVQRPEDVIEELAGQLKGMLKKPLDCGAGSGEETGEYSLTGEESAILNALDYTPKHADDIARELDIMPGKLLGLLLTLEIKGLVRQTEGKNFSKA